MGRQSLKAGYEFQKIDVEVQDVNPLYGRDTYSGQFTRPAGVGANNIYNLADFMLGLRSQYALSNVLIAQMRQQMHFTYLQDDVRVNDRLTLNLGVRYEYATPMWEADNVLYELRSRQPPDGPGERRLDQRSGAGQPRSQQLRPAAGLGLHADEPDRPARRVGRELRPQPTHRRRQPAADQRAAGDQAAVVNATQPAGADFRPTGAGLSSRADRSVARSTR